MAIGRRTFLSLASGAFAGSAAPLAATAAGLPDSQNIKPSVPSGVLPAGATSRFVRANGIRIHTVVAGSGPTVLLLHGWPQTWYAWAGTMGALSDRFTVVAPDLRGIGLSERTATGYDKRTIAADLSDLIAQVGGGAAHVVGHDMGGKAAYVLARLEPQRVRKLVLVDCLIPGTENTDALHGGAWHYGFHMARDIPELLTAGRERDYIGAQIRAWSHRKDAVDEASIAEYARHYASPGGMTAGFDYYRALPDDARFLASLPAAKLTMPVMAIAGRHGVGTRLAETLRPQADQLASLVVEDSGHFVVDESPDQFQAALRSFLLA